MYKTLAFLLGRKYPRKLQLNNYSCGACSTYSVLRYYKVPIKYKQVFDGVKCNKEDGTDDNNVCSFLIVLGFKATYRLKSKYKELRKHLQNGGVAICSVDGDHMITVWEITDKRVYLSDPSLKRCGGFWQKPEMFKKRWKGEVTFISLNRS